MLTTKRYEYMPFDNVRLHPLISNHRPFAPQKIAHYERDILENGLLEPLIVWERTNGEYYMVGGFHRLAAIKTIREKHPGYFDHVDVRVVAGELDEMRALNLKLNADRIDTKITDYFDTVLYLNNANWDKERIAKFLDKSVTWLEEIIRFVPGMDSRLRKMLEEGKVSWNRAKGICRQILAAPADKEKEVADNLIEELNKSKEDARPRRRPLSPQKAIKRLTKQFEKHPTTRYTVDLEDLLSLFMVLAGKEYTESHMERIRKTFPGLMD
ncbi:MAG: ParB N-terminal domain-containing protein [Deltaproteobacteria bacterium]|nr:ParB N-terminal domain-containing protein [Deltaproteobacteria bacterium]MBW1796122.1 ParB N-terminal domain-containing protein [Deltaproteobacteria bacterium]